jgi:hypothetical protein
MRGTSRARVLEVPVRDAPETALEMTARAPPERVPIGTAVCSCSVADEWPWARASLALSGSSYGVSDCCLKGW